MSSEKIVGKGEIPSNEQILLFPQYFLPHNPVFNPFPHNTFWHPWETSLLKTLWEKEKLLVTSNFSFSHSVFYPSG